MPLTILSYSQLLPMKGIEFSRQHINKLQQQGRFPKSFKTPNGNHRLWFEQVIDAYLITLASGIKWSAEREAQLLAKLKAIYGADTLLERDAG